jgi:hypothetical protein
VSTARLLPPDQIPASLWDAERGIIILPQALASAYAVIIAQKQLGDLAMSRDRNNPPVGGRTQELANTHFAQAFDGSSARAQLAFLDPHDDLPHVSDTFVNALAGNHVCLIDAPCGAGAATYAFLTAVADLRASGVLPRVPLDVDFVAADLSDPARQYAIDIHPLLTPHLEQQAIFLRPEFSSWDVTDRLSTTSLIQSFLAKLPNGSKRLLIVANFNGLLEKEGKRKEASPQLEELFRFCSGPNCRALWIEPNMNVVTSDGGLFAYLVAKAKEAWRGFMAILGLTDGEKATPFTSSARFREPLAPGVFPRVQVAVLPMSLERRT